MGASIAYVAGQGEPDAEALLARAVEVVQDATCGEDYQAVWPLLAQIAQDGELALGRGRDMLRSGDPAVRGTGCDLLGMAADLHEGLRAAAATALLELGEHEAEADVLWSVANALGSTADPRAVPLLVTLAGHEDPDVRFQVARALPAVWAGDAQAAEVAALIGLTADPDAEVRNWAAFGLGTQLAGADTPQIRAALWDRVGDRDADTREEAVCGLARRRDRGVVGLLAGLLSDQDGAHVLVFRAAAVLGAAEMVPALRDYDPGDPGIAEALAECDPAARDAGDEFAWALLCQLSQQAGHLDAALSARRDEPGSCLQVAAAGQLLSWSASALMERASGDPRTGARLVLADLHGVRQP
jgi:HEAT repeat protein